MYFEFLKNVLLPGENNKEFRAAMELYNYCRDAERNCRISPDNAIIAIRQALEVLVSGLLCEYGKKEFTREDSLCNMIGECKEVCGSIITGKTAKILHELRVNANNYVHVEKRINQASEYIVKGRHATVKDASEATLKLYICLTKIFGVEAKNIDVEDLPIGDYEILEKYEKQDYEAVTGKYKYLVEKKGSIVSSFAYIRPFSNVKGDENSVFNERDIAIQDVFKSISQSDYVVNGEEISVSDYNDVRYIKYNAKKDTKTLDQIVESLSVKETLSIIADVSRGLIEIMSGDVNVHHRSIRPTCIFVTREDNQWRGKIGCFETAKVEIESATIETVHTNMFKANKGSIFVHPMLRDNEITNGDWERGDVYSLAMILMYCVSSKEVNEGNIDYSIVTESFSEEFSLIMINTLMTGSIDTVPTMKEFNNALNQEIEDGKDLF